MTPVEITISKPEDFRTAEQEAGLDYDVHLTGFLIPVSWNQVGGIPTKACAFGTKPKFKPALLVSCNNRWRVEVRLVNAEEFVIYKRWTYWINRQKWDEERGAPSTEHDLMEKVYTAIRLAFAAEGFEDA